MPKVFVGYASEDRLLVEELVQELERFGWSVWWDKTDIGSGTIRAQIEKAIRAADCAIVVWSTAAIDKPWVLDEASRARSLGKPLLPIQIEAVDLPLGFGDLHTFDLSDWAGSLPDSELLRLERCLDDIAASRTVPSVPGLPDATQRATGEAQPVDRVHRAAIQLRDDSTRRRRVALWLGVAAAATAAITAVFVVGYVAQDDGPFNPAGSTVATVTTTTELDTTAVTGSIPDPSAPQPVPGPAPGSNSDTGGGEATTEPPVAVPDVVGLTLAQAKESITAAGLEVGPITGDEECRIGVSIVRSQSPLADAEAVPQSEIALTMACPPVAVPDVVGLTLAQAKEGITAAGLQVGPITRNDRCPSVIEPTVRFQAPSATTWVPQQSQVALEMNCLTPPTVMRTIDPGLLEEFPPAWVDQFVDDPASTSTTQAP